MSEKIDETELNFPLKVFVAGTHVEGRLKNIERYSKPGSHYELKREPGNKVDSNAIQFKQRFKNGGAIVLGYVPGKYAKDLAPMLDAGAQFKVLFLVAIIDKDSGVFKGLMLRILREGTKTA